jgi:hypothetical protein
MRQEGELMSHPDVKNSKEEEDRWFGLSDFERERFERHADFLIDQGYMGAARGAWWIRDGSF